MRKQAFLLLIILFIAGCAQQPDQSEEVTTMATLKMTSPVFPHNGRIPDMYTCTGDDMNPPLAIEGMPQQAKSVVLIMDDPDAPVGTWDHWIVYNIRPETTAIAEDSVPEGAVQGMNSWGRADYGGPCPPSGSHRYFFRLYALDIPGLSFVTAPPKKQIGSAMNGHILAQAELIGLYSKK